MKQCTKCKTTYIFVKKNFSKNKNSKKDGLAWWCKKCTLENKKQYIINNNKWLLEQHLNRL